MDIFFNMDIYHQAIKFLYNMKFIFGISCSPEVNNKVYFITELERKLNDYFKNRNYRGGINEYAIFFDVNNYPEGYEHLRHYYKPKYINYKIITNEHTGKQLEIDQQFNYSINIDNVNSNMYDKFVKATEEESKKMIVVEILNSLTYLDKLPKKVNNFDKEQFKSDLLHFF